MPQLDVATFLPQLVWLAITFAILYVMVTRLALPRVSEVLQARHERIEADFERAESMRKEAEQTLEKYQAAMAEARADAHQLVVEAGQKAAEIAAAQHDTLTAKLAKDLDEAEARIAAADASAVGEMRQVARELVREASGKLAGMTPDDAAIDAALARAAGE